MPVNQSVSLSVSRGTPATNCRVSDRSHNVVSMCCIRKVMPATRVACSVGDAFNTSKDDDLSPSLSLHNRFAFQRKKNTQTTIFGEHMPGVIMYWKHKSEMLQGGIATGNQA